MFTWLESLENRNRLLVSYRLFIAFILGYFCTTWLNVILAYFFHQFGLARAESVVFSMLLSLIFACSYVISSFCIRSFKHLNLSLVFLALILYSIRYTLDFVT